MVSISLVTQVPVVDLQIMSSLKNYLLNLNLFKASADSDEREENHHHYSRIIATRVYIVVLTLVLIIVSLVFWLGLETTIVTLEHPTRDQFEDLPLGSQCPCSRISLSYGNFTSLQPSFHQVCSSDFVSDRWIKAIFSGTNSTYFDSKDFRTFGSAQFQALAGFCRLSQANIMQSIASFNMNTLLSPYALPETVLQLQTQASIDQFQLTAPNAFGAQLQLVREITLNNRVMSGLQTNIRLRYDYIEGNQFLTVGNLMTYTELENESICNCMVNLDCQISSGIYDMFARPIYVNVDNVTRLMTIPGISAGCLPVNSLLQSTLECFYSQKCLDALISYFPTTEKFTAMPVVNQSRFSPSSTVKSIIDYLMVERWWTNISYENYYTQCAPISCTYSKVERHTFVFALQKLISLLSGLTIILRFVIPIPIQFIIQRLRNPQRTPRVHRKYRGVIIPEPVGERCSFKVEMVR